ncbi:MAG: GGDEF domain-containing protein [Clostridia bacterium]|nr:GGDEF domain-containing protein [Clostridia bacterium]
MAQRKHRLTLTTKYVMILCTLLLVLNVTLGLILMSRSGKSMKEMIRRNMLSIADTVAAALDGDALASVTEASVGTEEYNEIYSALYNVAQAQKNNSDIKYIYTAKKEGDKFVFLIDPDPVDPGLYGEEVVYTPSQTTAWNGVSTVDEDTYQDDWGSFYTAWSPVRNSTGKVVALVGVDFVADWFDQQIVSHTIFVIIGSVASLVAGAAIMALMASQLRRRIREVNGELLTLSDNVEKLTDEIRVRPGDEGKSLYECDKDYGSDGIGELRGKIHAMQHKLKAYMDYAHEQAYTDSMTGVGNKTAYLERVKEINSRINNGTADFAIVVFDVNGLKNTNDNYGHECGDRIITDTAAAIRRVFGDEQIYRIGGDEFIAILGSITEEELEARLKELQGIVENFNKHEKRYAMTLSFSGGGAVYRPGEDAAFKEVFKRADEAMYNNKGNYYKQFGDRRRTYEEDAKPISDK